MKWQNEGFGCDLRQSVRGNLILGASCDRKGPFVFRVLKLTFTMGFKQCNSFFKKFLLQNCSTSQYGNAIIQSRKKTSWILQNHHFNVFFNAKMTIFAFNELPIQPVVNGITSTTNGYYNVNKHHANDGIEWTECWRCTTNIEHYSHCVHITFLESGHP